MAKTIKLEFDGYYREEGLPPPGHDCAGIYVVYAGKYISEGTCELREVLYIGRSGDVDERPSSKHHKYKSWHEQLEKNEILYFSFANTDDEKRAEAALIYKIKPICNDTGKNGFHYPETTITKSERNTDLELSFTVQNTD
jgi:excinuclease UvrABC nuclease subunit